MGDMLLAAIETKNKENQEQPKPSSQDLSRVGGSKKKKRKGKKRKDPVTRT